MDNLVPRLYKEYGLESNERMLPFILDGLRPSERRCLYSANEIAKDKFKKSLTVSSHTTGHYHGHGGCYGTLCQLVRKGFLDGQGNFGSDVNADPDSTKPAAERYTECKLNNFSKELCFKLLKYVPYRTADVDIEKQEPEFLPSLFPICLLGGRLTEGIGFGYKSVIPSYSISDLNERLFYLLSKKSKKNKEPIIKPSIDCDILSDEEKLKNLLITGKEKIDVKGKYEHDPINKKIIIKSIPPKTRFDSILKKLDTELSNEDIKWIDKSCEKNGGTYIEFSVDKQRNVDKIYNNMLNKLDNALTVTVHFEIIVMDENYKIKKISIDEFLLKAYKNYKDACIEMFNKSIEKIDSFLDEYNNLKIVRPHLMSYIQNNDKIKDYKKAIKEISKSSSLSESIVKGLFSKYNINKLLTLEVDVDSIEKERSKYDEYLNNPDKYVISDYKSFLKLEEK